jgi:uncharacterized membrane protein YgdD (TMEM256/DUF423 family)
MNEASLTPAARRFVLIAGVMGFAGVLAGSFGAHGLREHLNLGLQVTFETAVRYQMYHALALLAAAWLCDRTDRRCARIAGWLFVVGIVLFSGSLYALVIGEMRQPEKWKWLGAITPFGGGAFMGGWIGMIIAAVKR